MCIAYFIEDHQDMGGEGQVIMVCCLKFCFLNIPSCIDFHNTFCKDVSYVNRQPKYAIWFFFPSLIRVLVVVCIWNMLFTYRLIFVEKLRQSASCQLFLMYVLLKFSQNLWNYQILIGYTRLLYFSWRSWTGVCYPSSFIIWCFKTACRLRPMG